MLPIAAPIASPLVPVPAGSTSPTILRCCYCMPIECGPSAARSSELVTRLSCGMTGSWAHHAPITGHGTDGAAVCCMRCCGIRARASGAARCDAVALALTQAGRVSPARTRTSAESTTGPIVAAVSTDIDGNGCICVCRGGQRAATACQSSAARLLRAVAS